MKIWSVLEQKLLFRQFLGKSVPLLRRHGHRKKTEQSHFRREKREIHTTPERGEKESKYSLRGPQKETIAQELNRPPASSDRSRELDEERDKCIRATNRVHPRRDKNGSGHYRLKFQDTLYRS